MIQLEDVRVADFSQFNALAQPGMMHTMGGPNTQFPLNPSAMPPQQAPNALQQPVRPDRPQFDMTALQSAMGSMQRGDLHQMFNNGGIGSLPQPFQDAFSQFHDYRNAMQQYRGDMRDYRHQMHGGNHMGHSPMMTPGGGGGGGPMQGGANTQFPLNQGFAAPGVGQSMSVQGMTPGVGPYGMPRY